MKVQEIFREFEDLKYEVKRLGSYFNEMFQQLEWDTDAPKLHPHAEKFIQSKIQISKKLEEN